MVNNQENFYPVNNFPQSKLPSKMSYDYEMIKATSQIFLDKLCILQYWSFYAKECSELKKKICF